MKLRIGILSTASIVPRLIGAVRAAEVYLSDSHSPYEGFTVSSIASRSLKNARQKALLWNVPKAFGSYEELIESGEADVIYIAMINSEHYHYAKLALEAGRHVLCEKPFTLEPSQAEELFALARRKSLVPDGNAEGGLSACRPADKRFDSERRLRAHYHG